MTTGAIVSDEAYVEASVCTLADVVAQYRELRKARAKLAAIEALAKDLHAKSSHSDYGDGRWDVAARVLDIINGAD